MNENPAEGNEVGFLARVPLFSRLARDELLRLTACAQRLVFSLGEEIIREGEQDRRLFVIVRGRVEVVKSRGETNERSLAELGPYQYFGEMAIIDCLVRSATVVAREETEVLVLDHEDLHREMARAPSVAMELLKTLSLRLRALEKILMQSLGGLLPICLHCKNIRDESGNWVPIEEYIADRSQVDFTHGICPVCMKKLYPKHFSNVQR